MEIKPITVRRSIVYPAIITTGLLCSCSGQQPRQILLGVPCIEHSSDLSDNIPHQQQTKQSEPPAKEQPPMRLAGSMPPPAPKSPTSKDKKKQADKGPRQQQPPQRMPGKIRRIP